MSNAEPMIRRAIVEVAPAIAACVNAAYYHDIERIGRPPRSVLDE